MIFGNANLARTLIVHLDRNEDILESLREIITKERIRNGLILTGYGTIDRCRYHAVATNGLPPVDEFFVVEAPLEVLSITGSIADGEIHAHIAVAGAQGGFGGHLEPGCRVLYLCDLVIAELTGTQLSFQTRPDTDLRLLTVAPALEEAGPAVEPGAGGTWSVAGRSSGWAPAGK